MTSLDYLQDRCRQWADQTQEIYRCPEHKEPNPFCPCVDATGKRVNGQIVYDGQWEERGNAIQAARRRYHAWADQQRPEVQTRREKFKQMVEKKHNEMTHFKEWQDKCAADGFITISQ